MDGFCSAGCCQLQLVSRDPGWRGGPYTPRSSWKCFLCLLPLEREKIKAGVQPGSDAPQVPLSSGTTPQHRLEEFGGGSSIQKDQGEDLKVTKAFLLSRDKLACCFGPAFKHCLLPARFLFPLWNFVVFLAASCGSSAGKCPALGCARAGIPAEPRSGAPTRHMNTGWVKAVPFSAFLSILCASPENEKSALRASSISKC